MSPNSRRLSEDIPGAVQTRIKALSHIQKPRGKHKKMTDIFPPSPELIENKDFSVDLENQVPLSDCETRRQINVSERKYSLRPKKSQPRVFYGFEPEPVKLATIQAKNIKTKNKIVLNENSLNVILHTKKHISRNIDKRTSLTKSSTIDNTCVDNLNNNSLTKNAIGVVYKPQRNARKYLKYGTRIPSFNDILRSREELIKFKEGVACVAGLQKDPIVKNDNSEFHLKSRDSEELLERLSCKHIPLKELKVIFKGYTDFVIGIGKGTIPSDRHRVYMQNPFGGSGFNWSDLTFNISMSSFSIKQKVLLAKLTKKTLCANKLMYNNQYYFKVVLPELCFKMFMREHKLTEDEATKYLTNPRLA